MSRIDSPLVISFYTENTPYQLEIFSLVRSCQELGIEFEVTALPCLGSWERNCSLKPRFIRNKLLEKKRPVFWVDADGVFKKTPDFSSFLHSDFCLREVKDSSHPRWFQYRAGSVFVNYTPGGMNFAKAWDEYCQNRIDAGSDLLFLDQVAIFDLMQKGLEVNYAPLPPAYCKVFDESIEVVDPSEVVIEHFQASRRFK